MTQRTSSVLSSSDLLRLLRADSGLTQDEVLAIAGYSIREQSEHSEPTELVDQNIRKKTNHEAPVVRGAVGATAKSYLRVTSVHSRATIDSVITQPTLLEHRPIELPEDRSLLPFKDFNPAFRNLAPAVLKANAELSAKDLIPTHKSLIKHWTRSLSKAQIPSTAPTRSDTVEAGDLLLVEDYSKITMPFWRDIRVAADMLARHFGRSRMRRHEIKFMDERTHPGGDQWPSAGSGCNVMIIGSLSSDAASGNMNPWFDAIRTWNKLDVRVHVWSPAHYDSLREIKTWCDGVNGWESSGSHNQSALELLLACLSTVQWCSISLLRYWRRLLDSIPELGINSAPIDEAFVWNHDDVWCTPQDCGLNSNVTQHRKRFAQLPHSVQNHVRASSYYFRDNIADTVIVEEGGIASSLGFDFDQPMLKRAESRLKLSDQIDGAALDEFTRGWLRRLAHRQDREYWQDNPQLAELCQWALRDASDASDLLQLPSEMQTASQSDFHDLYLGLQAGQLVASATEVAGSVFFKFKHTETLIVYAKDDKDIIDKRQSHEFELSLNREVSADSLGDRFSVRGASEICDFERIRKPSWAVRMEQNSSGLVATLNDDRRLHWCASGGEHEHLLQGAPGAWIDEEQVLNSQTVVPTKSDSKPTNPFTVSLNLPDTPEFNLCWIPPGEYNMGSPEDDLGRYEDEQQHQVLITRGFWMMETPCTQALWESVTGENPSEFRGSSHPVENVSWDDIHEKFLPRINELMPDMAFRLPSEAEWEYACRAGTESAFYTGETLGLDKARYLGHLSGVKFFLDDEDTQKAFKTKYPNGSDTNWADFLRVPEDAIVAARAGDESWFEPRQGTCKVKSFQPNARGLYDMHGNVWEWCADALDRLEPYGAETRIDPILAHTGRARVVRGGSWNYGGRLLRSACRNYDGPGHRSNGLGFRLVAGSRPGQPDGEEHTAASVAERNVRSVRRSKE